MKKKSRYEEAECVIILLEDSDVISTSGESWGGSDGNIDSGGWT